MGRTKERLSVTRLNGSEPFDPVLVPFRFTIPLGRASGTTAPAAGELNIAFDVAPNELAFPSNLPTKSDGP